MSNKTNDQVYDFLADQCEAGIITLEQYNLMKKNLNEMPSAEEMLDDHIQIEVEEHKDELIKEYE